MNFVTIFVCKFPRNNTGFFSLFPLLDSVWSGFLLSDETKQEERRSGDFRLSISFYLKNINKNKNGNASKGKDGEDFKMVG